MFMGTPAIAAHILDRLVTAADPRFAVVAVVTRPDEPRGRGLALAQSEVAAVAALRRLPVLKPVKIRTAEFLAEMKSHDPDLIVVAAYGRILPQAILDAPRVAPINVHASLLPRHRGAAPIEGAILAGDATTGVTIMRIMAAMDSGPMILQRAIAIAPDDTQASLKIKLAELGAQALLDALELYARGAAVETSQDDSLATYTKQIRKPDAEIDWSADAARLERMARAFDPWPIARTTLGGAPILIWRARVLEPDRPVAAAPGTLLAVKPEPVVQCGGGTLVLTEVQAPGRKRMRAADFFNGRKIAPGARLGV
ncbi:MAG TPA: methionyl-tRNA formyltransferase [Candidatus Binataceae bacterium]|nr:methionyl-tRNA formyltransferase [Candidatus Binataceae bacterium]